MRWVIYVGPHGLTSDPILQYHKDNEWKDIPTVKIPERLDVKYRLIQHNEIIEEDDLCCSDNYWGKPSKQLVGNMYNMYNGNHPYFIVRLKDEKKNTG